VFVQKVRTDSFCFHSPAVLNFCKITGSNDLILVRCIDWRDLD
jgi:hypothetical protein